MVWPLTPCRRRSWTFSLLSTFLICLRAVKMVPAFLSVPRSLLQCKKSIHGTTAWKVLEVWRLRCPPAQAAAFPPELALGSAVWLVLMGCGHCYADLLHRSFPCQRTASSDVPRFLPFFGSAGGCFNILLSSLGVCNIWRIGCAHFLTLLLIVSSRFHFRSFSIGCERQLVLWASVTLGHRMACAGGGPLSFSDCAFLSMRLRCKGVGCLSAPCANICAAVRSPC